MIRQAATASPLYWPPGWPRTESPTYSRFGPTTIAKEARLLRWELERLGAFDWILSTNLDLNMDGTPRGNQRQPDDQGVSVWFELDGEERVLACDRWDKVEHNIRAIMKHIESIRAQERWGVGSMAQAFAGFAALPEQAGGKGWRDVLGIGRDETVSLALIDERFRKKAMTCHPDHGGSSDEWHELAMARKQARDAAR